MEELKPCPFCGGRNTKANFKRKHVRYNYCPKCGNPMLVVKKEVQDEAVSEA